MLLILTNSYDGTTDLLIHKLPTDRIFRINCDLLSSYRIKVKNDGFVIEDGFGRSVASHQIKKFYYRKPWNASTDEYSEAHSDKRFYNKEMRYLIAELINWLWIKGKIVLVEPYAERRCGKLIQLMIAKNYFSVPNWMFSYRNALKTNDAPQIVKTFSAEQVSKDKVLYTTQVKPERLDPEYPWFIEDYVAAENDMTVVYCRGRLFAYNLSRTFVEKSADWREFISLNQIWTCFDLPSSLGKNIKAFMKHLKLHYGRLDFLITRNGNIFFCEVNTNGQYAWLDFDGKNGLLDSIISEISPFTRVHPIPHACPIDALTILK